MSPGLYRCVCREFFLELFKSTVATSPQHFNHHAQMRQNLAAASFVSVKRLTRVGMVTALRRFVLLCRTPTRMRVEE